MLGLDVVVLVLWALNRDIAYLLRAVDIDNLGPPGVSRARPHLGRKCLRCRYDFRHSYKNRPIDAGLYQRGQIAGVCIQIIWPLAR